MLLRTWSKQAAQNIIQVVLVTKKNINLTSHYCNSNAVLLLLLQDNCFQEKQMDNISDPLAQDNDMAVWNTLQSAIVIPAG